jgi:hypothetical protein
MVLVPVDLAYVQQLEPDRTVRFDFSDDTPRRVAGFILMA